MFPVWIWHTLQALPGLSWLITGAVCQQCVSKQRWIKRERKMRSCSSEWKAEEAGGVVSQTSPRCRYNPEGIVRGQFVTGCPAAYFLPSGGREKKNNAGPDWICPPLLPWPIPKSHWVIKLNYCCKTYVARRAPKHIHYVARERVRCSRPPWTLAVRMTVSHAGLSHRWRRQRNQYQKEEVLQQ